MWKTHHIHLSLMRPPVPKYKSNMMGMWSIDPKGLIALSIHIVDHYLLGIALLSIWLSIMRNLWNSWTLVPHSCFILGWMDPMLTCPLRTKLQRLAEVDTSFLRLVSCLLHPVHSALQKGIKQLFQGQVSWATSNNEGSGELLKKKGTFDMDDFFTDICSVF